MGACPRFPLFSVFTIHLRYASQALRFQGGFQFETNNQSFLQEAVEEKTGRTSTNYPVHSSRRVVKCQCPQERSLPTPSSISKKQRRKYLQYGLDVESDDLADHYYINCKQIVVEFGGARRLTGPKKTKFFTQTINGDGHTSIIRASSRVRLTKEGKKEEACAQVGKNFDTLGGKDDDVSKFNVFKQEVESCVEHESLCGPCKGAAGPCHTLTPLPILADADEAKLVEVVNRKISAFKDEFDEGDAAAYYSKKGIYKFLMYPELSYGNFSVGQYIGPGFQSTSQNEAKQEFLFHRQGYIQDSMQTDVLTSRQKRDLKNDGSWFPRVPREVRWIASAADKAISNMPPSRYGYGYGRRYRYRGRRY